MADTVKFKAKQHIHFNTSLNITIKIYISENVLRSYTSTTFKEYLLKISSLKSKPFRNYGV